MIARSGRRVFRTGVLTAGEGFQAQAAYGSLRRRQDPAGQGVGPVSLAQGIGSAWRPRTPPPSGFAWDGTGESGRCVSPRETRHFSQRGC